MNPEARDLIARSGLDEGVSAGLTRLATVVERAKDAGALRNTSNTAGAVQTGTMIGTAVTSLFLGQPMVTAGIAGTAAATNISARALTSPRFLRAVNRAAASGDVRLLRRLAEKPGETGAIEAATILRLALQQSSSEPTPPARASRGGR